MGHWETRFWSTTSWQTWSTSSAPCRRKPGARSARCSGCTATKAANGWRATWEGRRGGQRLFHHRIAAARRLARRRLVARSGHLPGGGKRNNLQMRIFDEKWWPSQGVGGRVPKRYAAKRLAATAVAIEGPKSWSADGYGGPRHVTAVAGRRHRRWPHRGRQPGQPGPLHQRRQAFLASSARPVEGHEFQLRAGAAAGPGGPVQR